MPDAQTRSQAIALRRGLTMLGMTLVVRIGQLAATVPCGRFALRIWAGLIGLLLLFVLLLFTVRSFALGLYFNPITLQVLRVATLALGVGWALLFVNAWRIANPSALSPRGRIVLPSIAFALALAVSFGSWTLAARSTPRAGWSATSSAGAARRRAPTAGTTSCCSAATPAPTGSACGRTR